MLLNSKDYDSNYDSGYDLGWHLTFPVNVMLNLSSNKHSAKFFLGGGYEYSVGFDNMYDFQSWNAGLGFNSSNYIFYLYYKRAFKGENYLDNYHGITCKNNIFGLSISWLFNL